METGLALHLLGTFQAALDGQPLAGFRSDKIRALLAYLAVAGGQPHTRDHLATLLWGEYGQQAARTSLRKALSNLRRLLPGLLDGDPPALAITRQHVSLDVNHTAVQVDVIAFRRLLAHCRQHAHEDIDTCAPCRRRLAGAADHYRGDFLAGFNLADAPAFTEWQLLQQEQLHQQAVTILETLAAGALASADHDTAQARLRQLLKLLPWSERAHRQLMTSLAASGQRGQALAQFESCRQILHEELGVEPAAETLTLYEAIRAGEPTTATPFFHRHNLPAPTTPLVGRRQELAWLEEQLTSDVRRLVTLLGPGGAGKTRLAQAVGRRLVRHFADGVWLVPLATVTREGPIAHRLATAIAGVLNLSLQDEKNAQADLATYLRGRHLLLLLDNLEPHLPAAAAPLQQLLDEAPQLNLLVTSQIRLNLRAESVLALGGLALPDPAAPAAAQQQAPAVALFTERARRAYPDFVLGPADLPAVGEICRLLEGMPLGLELAASLTPHFSCPEIAGTIAQNLDQLALPQGDLPPRQQSLRAMWAYTWQWLTPAEQQVLARASIFAGEFSREGLLAVAGATLGDLVSLVNKSLLRTVAPGRYTLHGLLRHFAAAEFARTAGREEQQAVRARHSHFYAEQIQAREKSLYDTRQPEGYKRLHGDLGNVLLAWEWAVAHAAAPLLEKMLRPLATFYDDHGRYREGMRRVQGAARALAGTSLAHRLRLWEAHFHYRLGEAQAAAPLLQEVLEQASAPGLHARAHYLQGCLLLATGDPEQSVGLLSRARDHYREQGRDRELANTLTALGRSYELLGRYDDAQRLLRQSLHLKRQQGAPLPLATALNNLALLLHRRGENEEADALLQEAFTLYEGLENEIEMAAALANLGLVAHGRRAYEQARHYLQRALALHQKGGREDRVAIILNNLGDVANAQGEYEQARAYLERSLALKRARQNRRGMIFSLIHLGHTALGLEQPSEAAGFFHEALALATELGVEPLQLAALGGEAERLAATGRQTHALHLLAVVAGHPAAWQRTRAEATQLAARLQATTPSAPPAEPLPDVSLATLIDHLLAGRL